MIKINDLVNLIYEYVKYKILFIFFVIIIDVQLMLNWFCF